MGVRFAGTKRGCAEGAVASLLSGCRGEDPISLSPPSGHSFTHSHPDLLPGAWPWAGHSGHMAERDPAMVRRRQIHAGAPHTQLVGLAPPRSARRPWRCPLPARGARCPC